MIYLFLLIFASLFFLVITSLLKKLGVKYRLYDEPDGGILKVHQRQISYLGGVGIFLAFVLTLVLAKLVFHLSFRWTQIFFFLLSSAVIITLGLWDDLKWKKAVNPCFKLFCQFLAGAIIVWIFNKVGISLHFSINLIIASLIAGFYVVGTMNAINMIDGLDGLAGGLALISLFGFVTILDLNHDSFLYTISLCLMGSLIGFLIYNWHPASIFMGDNGSHFLGFILAALAVATSRYPLSDFPKFLGPILIIGLPIIDAGWAIIRRLYHKKSPFRGDRGHLYDRLNQRGLSVPRTVLLCYLIQIIIVSVGVLIYHL